MSPKDPVIDALISASAAVCNSNVAAAVEAMTRIAVPPKKVIPRRPLTIGQVAAVFLRDHFTCRYCGKHVVPTPVLRALSSIPALATLFPYTAAKRADSTHPAYRSHGATCDHIVPLARGGSRDDAGNLATACWECNRSKADQDLEQVNKVLLPEPENDTWDGLTRRYRRIWEVAGQPNDAYHRKWLKAFDL